jgi:serine/threonine protein kinase
MEERFGPWELRRRVALGNYADVSEAVRDGAATTIALKRLHAHAAREAELHALFRNECAIATTIPPHPGLVRGLEIGEADDGRPWMAMPLVGGEDLRRRIDAGAAPDEAGLRTVMLELCSALDHLHATGWIHGDVNPSNVLVETATHALLCDFGVARRPGEPGPVRGTHAYMAPEQVRGEPWTAATDVFALGVVLWELCAGTRLFKRSQTFLTMDAVITHDPAPLDHPLNAVAHAALVKDPTKRYPTPGALAAAIQSA